jgi:hypothetical protein
MPVPTRGGRILTDQPAPAWATVVRTGETWLRHPAPDAAAAIHLARQWKRDGYAAFATDCRCRGDCCDCLPDTIR